MIDVPTTKRVEIIDPEVGVDDARERFGDPRIRGVLVPERVGATERVVEPVAEPDDVGHRSRLDRRGIEEAGLGGRHPHANEEAEAPHEELKVLVARRRRVGDLVSLRQSEHTGATWRDHPFAIDVLTLVRLAHDGLEIGQRRDHDVADRSIVGPWIEAELTAWVPPRR